MKPGFRVDLSKYYIIGFVGTWIRIAVLPSFKENSSFWTFAGVRFSFLTPKKASRVRRIGHKMLRIHVESVSVTFETFQLTLSGLFLQTAATWPISIATTRWVNVNDSSPMIVLSRIWIEVKLKNLASMKCFYIDFSCYLSVLVERHVHFLITAGRNKSYRYRRQHPITFMRATE